MGVGIIKSVSEVSSTLIRWMGGGEEERLAMLMRAP